MNTDEIKELAQRPGMIPGIFNYCDRWCERCPFTSRCMNYAMQREQHPASNQHDMQGEEFWNELSSALKVTLDLLKESAADHGIDINNLDMEGVEEEQVRIDEEASNHPVARAAFDYIEMADSWLNGSRGLFQNKERELRREAELELPGSKPHLKAVQVADAIDVISWYHTMIYPKVMRALGQSRRETRWEEENGFQKDSDGSAKVALVSIDCSIAAWGMLRDHFPESGDSILDRLVHLERLRTAIEKTFPSARAFQRPGFDYVPAEPEA